MIGSVVHRYQRVSMPCTGSCFVSAALAYTACFFALPFALSAYTIVSKKIGFNLTDLFLIIIALVSARVFGMSINRILDLNIDKKNPRTKDRGLIIGSITMKGALIIVAISLLIFYTTLLYFNILALFLYN